MVLALLSCREITFLMQTSYPYASGVKYSCFAQQSGWESEISHLEELPSAEVLATHVLKVQVVSQSSQRHSTP